MGDRKPVVVIVRAMAARMDDAEVESRRVKVLSKNCSRRRRGTEHMLVWTERLCVEVLGMVCAVGLVCAGHGRISEDHLSRVRPHVTLPFAVLLLPASTGTASFHFGRTRTREKALTTTPYQ